MWQCAECGESMSENYSFCWRCGVKKAAAANPSTTSADRKTSDPSFFNEYLPAETSEDRFLPLRKELWTFIFKAVGLYLLLQALLTLPDIFSGIYIAQSYNDLLNSLSQSLSPLAKDAQLQAMSEKVSETYRSLVIIPIVKMLFYLGLGVYFVKGASPLSRFFGRKPD
jgi:hypothetical protein